MSKDIQFTFPKEKTKELIDRSYGTAKSHGFHDKELSPQHLLMLAISEVSEAIEADRNGRFHFYKNLHPQMATIEEWKTICHHEDYEVSNLGRIKSKDMKVWNGKNFYMKKGRLLKAGLGKTGYYTVALNGKTYKVAVLVASAFLKKINKSDVVNHIDGNKTNDNVGNLEWVSPSLNNKHALQTGLRNPAKSKLLYEEKVYIAFQHKNGRTYTSIMKDRDWGVTKSAIQKVCKEYKKYTDSVEFELADVCIRLFDFCGTFGIVLNEPSNKPSVFRVSWIKGKSFCETCFYLCALLTSLMKRPFNTLDVYIGDCLAFVYDICDYYGIDLMKHIEWKMQYNESRPPKHGKNY